MTAEELAVGHALYPLCGGQNKVGTSLADSLNML
jgi:hypothetical protein